MANLGKYSIQPSPAQATAKSYSFKFFYFLEKEKHLTMLTREVYMCSLVYFFNSIISSFIVTTA